MEATHRTTLTAATHNHVAALTDELAAALAADLPVTTEQALRNLGATTEDLDAITDYAYGDSPFLDLAELVENLDASND